MRKASCLFLIVTLLPLASCEKSSAPDLPKASPLPISQDIAEALDEATPTRTVTRTDVPDCPPQNVINIRGEMSDIELGQLVHRIEAFVANQLVVDVSISGEHMLAYTAPICTSSSNLSFQFFFQRSSSITSGQSEWVLLQGSQGYIDRI